ncbi:MAG: SdrD B-like domain-containing protein [Ferruginibacter sp.]
MKISNEKNYWLSFIIILWTVMFLGAEKSAAQVTISTSLVEKNNITSILAGQTYTLQLNYSVSSTTGSAIGMKATIDLPDNILMAGSFVGTVDAPASSFVYTSSGDKKIVIPFNSPLASGSSGVLEFSVITQNFTTLDNTPLTTTAVITDNGGHSSQVVTNTVTAHAAAFLCAKKILLNGGAVGYPTTYRVYIHGSDGSYGFPDGTLKPGSISIMDQLPAGAEFISAKVYKGNSYQYDAVYDAGTGIVTAQIPDLTFYKGSSGWQMNFIPYVDIAVRYNSPAFNAGDSVTNTATVQFTPLGQSPQTLANGFPMGSCTPDLIEGTRLTTPVVSAVIGKGAPVSTIYSGQTVSYYLSFSNTGNVPLDSLSIVEDIPSYFRIDTTSPFNGLRVDGAAGVIDHYEYQTDNSGGNWIILPAGTSLPATPPDGGYVTKIKFVFVPPFPANTNWPANGYVLIYLKAVEVSSSTVTTNCITWNSTTPGLPVNRTACADVTINPRPSTSKINFSITSSPGCASPVSIDQPVTFTGNVIADNGYADALNPVCAIFIPSGFKYIPGLESFNAASSGITAIPVLEIVKNYITIAGADQDMYRWTFPDGTVLPHGKSFSVNVVTAAGASLTPGTKYTGNFVATASNASINSAEYNYGNITDTKDWDLDGNTTETFGRANSNYRSCDLSVLPSASLQSVKLVKGLLDSVYTKYPAVANTVPGGNADYKLVVKNTGNITMKNITLVDILPYEGDRGVIDTTLRASEWRPNLAGPIAAPAGVTVYYSTVANPCRDEVKQPSSPSPYPADCITADWSTTPPADLTQVQSLKIDFGTTTLAGGDSLVFSWPMRAPVKAKPGDIAWSSFAFTATRADNNTALIPAEPVKVGIKTLAGSPGFFGDKVWYDTDHDGIQGAAEGGIDGVIVRLFKPVSPGIQNPATDPMFSFTITGNGGAYLFSNLPPADYYAVYEIPAGYSASPLNAPGSNAGNNSDGTSITYNGKPAVMTSITNISNNENDLSWDQGFYCSITPAVPVTAAGRLGENLTVTATGGTTYDWIGPNNFTATTAAITISNFTAADTGIYYVTVSDASCAATLQVIIKIDSTVVIGDKVWQDTDGDGIQNAGEPGVENTAVTLYNNSGTAIATAITDAAGAYSFSNLPAGSYYLEFAPPASYAFTASNGTDINDETNSDASQSSGYTATFTANAGATITGLDAGLIKLSLLANAAILAQVSMQDDAAVISWNLKAENNISHYEVERSIDGRAFSSTAYTVTAIANNGNATSYHISDNTKALKNLAAVYYRIKAISNNGKTVYSNTATLKLIKNTSVSTWPNPAKNNIYVSVTANANCIVETRLLDMKGKLVKTGSYKAAKGNNQFILDGLANLAKGIYILEISNNNEITISRIIKE